MITVLSQDLNWWLCAVHLQSWHIQVIHKKHKVFSEWGTKYTFAPENINKRGLGYNKYPKGTNGIIYGSKGT